jgi:hypothetical protein
MTWQTGSILILGSLFVLPACVFVAKDLLSTYKRNKRRHRRLFEFGHLYSDKE